MEKITGDALKGGTPALVVITGFSNEKISGLLFRPRNRGRNNFHCDTRQFFRDSSSLKSLCARVIKSVHISFRLCLSSAKQQYEMTTLYQF